MRPGDGVSVDEGEELLEDGEERPVGEDTDALLGVETAAVDGPPVHHAEQTEPDVLPLRQKLLGERLVELDGSAVNLQEQRGNLSLAPPVRVLVGSLGAPPTLSPEAEVRTKVEKMGSWYLEFRGQLSTVTPIGRQKTGTDSGRGKDSRSSSGYRLIRPAEHRGPDHRTGSVLL